MAPGTTTDAPYTNLIQGNTVIFRAQDVLIYDHTAHRERREQAVRDKLRRKATRPRWRQ